MRIKNVNITFSYLIKQCQKITLVIVKQTKATFLKRFFCLVQGTLIISLVGISTWESGRIEALLTVECASNGGYLSRARKIGVA